ncbi:MAG: bL21 family ribosomal protein [Candidatus Omnitrophica bacterium]|nr:bL21 family ribosomal protein [Candidatus Omnitrophota bacterium]
MAYKYIRRKAKDRKVGHRKKLTSIRIKDIAL